MKLLGILSLGALLVTAPQLASAGGPYGIERPRLPNNDLVIDELPPAAPGSMQLVRVYPQISLPKMLLLIEAPDNSGRRFVLSQTGRIYVFPGTEDPAPGEVSTFLDISSKVCDNGESGLLGLAFDPDYATNGEFYVYYSKNESCNFVPPGSTSRVSRFTNDDPSDNSVDANTEETILEVPQPYDNHNGGMIAFGPDNMLYVALGDGGSGGDPLNSGQDTTTLLGSLLRIDVRGTPDSGLNYRIPTDNPFFTSGPAGANTRKEIWAYGLRNPWRFSFDMTNDSVYLADVGQSVWEEVNIIQRGRNYGWRIREGDHCYNPSSGCTSAGLTRPIAEYSHTGGRVSVTGGFVYYGSAVPELYGKYIFGDYGSREVFAINHPETPAGQLANISVLVGPSGGVRVAGFGQDRTGEVFVLDYQFNSTGGIYVIRPAGGGGTSNFPTRLSDMPSLLLAGSGRGHEVQGVIPYTVASALWSDGTHKERYMAIPGLGQIEYSNEEWDFPENTVLIKNFELPLDRRDPDNSLLRIETRLLIKKDDQWHGFAYEWDDAEQDAMLLTTAKTRHFTVIDHDGSEVGYNWVYPSRAQCIQCHTPAAGFVLGPRTPQMNCEFLYPASGVQDNQLRTLDWISVFDQPLPDHPDNLPRLVDYRDTSASLNDRARSYLMSNCAHCHQPGGGTPANIDLRWNIPNAQTNAIGTNPLLGTVGIPNAKIIAPGDPDRSVLLERMERRDGWQMPPIGTTIVDPYGTELIREWIESLGAAGSDGWVFY